MDSIHKSRKVATNIVGCMCNHGRHSLMKIMLQCTDTTDCDWAVWYAVKAGMEVAGVAPLDSSIFFAVQRHCRRSADMDAYKSRNRQGNKYLLKQNLRRRKLQHA